MSKKKILIRADGSQQIGLGHIYRCLALVGMIQSEFDCFFFTRNTFAALSSTIRAVCPVFFLDENFTEAEEIACMKNHSDSCTIVIIDGYHFSSGYQREIKKWAKKLVAIDDKAEIYFYADLIINHGGAEMETRYRTKESTKLLLGLSYVLLRKPFLDAAKQKKNIAKIDTMLICMGGSDPYNATIKVLNAALKSSFVRRIIVITGGAYSNIEELNSLLSASPRRIIHEQNIKAERIVELLNESDIVICPSSSIALEVCCTRAGLLTGLTADNQTGILKQLVDYGCAISAGDFNTVSENALIEHINALNNAELVNGMINSQVNMIDGLSGKRILNELKMLAEC